jgi:hypothetical protein
VLATAAPRAQSGDPEEDERARRLQTTVGPRADEAPPATPRGLTSLPRLHEYVTPVVGSMPLRLAPGEKGEVRIALALGGSAALAAGAHLELGYEARQGSLLLGRHRVGADARDLRDGAILTLPVEVDASAPLGNHGLLFTLEADLVHEGDRSPLGRFSMRFGGRLEVMAKPAAPAPHLGAPGDLVVAAPAVGQERPPSAAPADAAAGDSAARPRDPLATPAPDADPAPEAAPTSSVAWSVGAVALALLGLLHLLGRAKRA